MYGANALLEALYENGDIEADRNNLAMEGAPNSALPDFVMLFSSTSAAIGAAGQVDYVAANGYLNRLAEAQQQKGRPVFAVSWGVWSEVGMAAAAAEKMGIAPPARKIDVSSPYFTSLERLPSGRAVLGGTINTQTHWALEDHRTASGHAIFPGTGYLDLFRAALAALEEPTEFTIKDLYFFRPLAVP